MEIRFSYSVIERYKRPVGQAVKTPPSHGDNMGSSPVRVTNETHTLWCAFLLYPYGKDEKTIGSRERIYPRRFPRVPF